jgi:hypothetical protein
MRPLAGIGDRRTVERHPDLAVAALLPRIREIRLDLAASFVARRSMGCMYRVPSGVRNNQVTTAIAT